MQFVGKDHTQKILGSRLRKSTEPLNGKNSQVSVAVVGQSPDIDVHRYCFVPAGEDDAAVEKEEKKKKETVPRNIAPITHLHSQTYFTIINFKIIARTYLYT